MEFRARSATIHGMNGRLWALVAFCLILPALALGSQADELSPEHRKWLEEEVVYIITDKEKDVFLTLETFEDRERFIQAFWGRRDPNRATPENEFRDEHYRRIEFANLNFSKQTSRPGWKTDQGRMYIILGKPRERQVFESYQYLTYCELWFYQGDISKGLPNFFYLLFHKPQDVGEYKLYSPTIDGPTSLIRGTPGFSDDSARSGRNAPGRLHRPRSRIPVVRYERFARLLYRPSLARCRHGVTAHRRVTQTRRSHRLRRRMGPLRKESLVGLLLQFRAESQHFHDPDGSDGRSVSPLQYRDRPAAISYWRLMRPNTTRRST